MRVKVLFFGQLREVVGLAEDSLDVRSGTPIEEVFHHYGVLHPRLNQFRPSLVASRNQEFASWDDPVAPGDEIAFLPPVSGG